MTDIAITVASGTPFNTDDSNAVLSITVTNTALVPSAASTNAYYYVSLSDGTTTETYTFAVAVTGSITAGMKRILSLKTPHYKQLPILLVPSIIQQHNKSHSLII